VIDSISNSFGKFIETLLEKLNNSAFNVIEKNILKNTKRYLAFIGSS
jgi:hypothetical protein